MLSTGGLGGRKRRDNRPHQPAAWQPSWRYRTSAGECAPAAVTVCLDTAECGRVLGHKAGLCSSRVILRGKKTQHTAYSTQHTASVRYSRRRTSSRMHLHPTYTMHLHRWRFHRSQHIHNSEQFQHLSLPFRPCHLKPSTLLFKPHTHLRCRPHEEGGALPEWWFACKRTAAGLCTWRFGWQGCGDTPGFKDTYLHGV